MSDEVLEPKLENFARTALELAKAEVFEISLTTDTGVEIRVGITVVSEGPTNG